MSQTNQSFNASIVEIYETVNTKSNGKEYLTARVQFKDGPLAGKVYFAQRTLGVNAQGMPKATISVGQNIRAVMNIVEDENGKKRPFFEISTSTVDDADSIMAALGL